MRSLRVGIPRQSECDDYEIVVDIVAADPIFDHAMLCSERIHSERGFSLLELLSALAIAALLIGLAVLVAGPLVGNESGRGAVYELQTLVQLARMEAVARNRECRLLLCPTLREIRVIDTRGTLADPSDDEVLHGTVLPETVSFERPDAGSAVEWASIGGSPEWFQLRFASDGTVEAGEGDVIVHGGDRYGKVAVFTSGGTQVTAWRASGWAEY
jgi:prepilin-type N-terminal cleavage/methylation domain-containing protein